MCKAARVSALAAAVISGRSLSRRRVGALIRMPMKSPSDSVCHKYREIRCPFQLDAFAANPAAVRQTRGPFGGSYCPDVSFGPSSRFRNKDFQRSRLFLPGPIADDDRFFASTVPAAARPQMFGFGKTIKDPLADAKTVERWLVGFPANDPLAMHAGVLAELGRLGERDARRTPARLEAVFQVDLHTDPLRKNLTAQYLEHGN